MIDPLLSPTIFDTIEVYHPKQQDRLTLLGSYILKHLVEFLDLIDSAKLQLNHQFRKVILASSIYRNILEKAQIIPKNLERLDESKPYYSFYETCIAERTSSLDHIFSVANLLFVNHPEGARSLLLNFSKKLLRNTPEKIQKDPAQLQEKTPIFDVMVKLAKLRVAHANLFLDSDEDAISKFAGIVTNPCILPRTRVALDAVLHMLVADQRINGSFKNALDFFKQTKVYHLQLYAALLLIEHPDLESTDTQGYVWEIVNIKKSTAKGTLLKCYFCIRNGLDWKTGKPISNISFQTDRIISKLLYKLWKKPSMLMKDRWRARCLIEDMIFQNRFFMNHKMTQDQMNTTHRFRSLYNLYTDPRALPLDKEKAFYYLCRLSVFRPNNKISDTDVFSELDMRFIDGDWRAGLGLVKMYLDRRIKSTLPDMANILSQFLFGNLHGNLPSKKEQAIATMYAVDIKLGNEDFTITYPILYYYLHSYLRDPEVSEKLKLEAEFYSILFSFKKLIKPVVNLNKNKEQEKLERIFNSKFLDPQIRCLVRSLQADFILKFLPSRLTSDDSEYCRCKEYLLWIIKNPFTRSSTKLASIMNLKLLLSKGDELDYSLIFDLFNKMYNDENIYISDRVLANVEMCILAIEFPQLKDLIPNPEKILLSIVNNQKSRISPTKRVNIFKILQKKLEKKATSKQLSKQDSST